MKHLCLILFLLPVALFQTGCSGDSSADDVDANGQPVSAVPWNKPENWETTGQLGALTQ